MLGGRIGVGDEAQHWLERYLREAPARIVLAVMPDDPLREDAVAQLRAAGAKSVEMIDFDALDTAGHPAVIDAALSTQLFWK